MHRPFRSRNFRCHRGQVNVAWTPYLEEVKPDLLILNTGAHIHHPDLHDEVMRRLTDYLKVSSSCQRDHTLISYDLLSVVTRCQAGRSCHHPDPDAKVERRLTLLEQKASGLGQWLVGYHQSSDLHDRSHSSSMSLKPGH